MNSSNINSSNTSFVSTFLSHSSADKPLVESVAERLGRLGVLTWFDKNELLEMGSLENFLKQAVQQQATLTIFLSEASAQSSWCRDELRWAMEASEKYEHLLPVYLGNPLKLVKEHDLLRSRFLHQDGDKVDQLGYACQQDPAKEDPNAIAKQIAATAYSQTIPKNWSEVVVILDQRGNGPRRGTPTLPDNILKSSTPKLTFRPSFGMRQPRELLTGTDWNNTVEAMVEALSSALNTVRGDTRKVRVIGHAQTGLMWAVGQHFDRTTSADLYAYDKNGGAITNKGQIRHTSLQGGNSNAADQIGKQPSLQANATHTTVALGVGSKEKFAAYTVQRGVPDVPLFWIESGLIQNTDQAMNLVADLVASVEKLRRNHNTSELILLLHNYFRDMLVGFQESGFFFAI